jgi:predicted deacetylase
LLKLAGIEPDGFVAPAYAYTPELRSVLPQRFRWWAGMLGVHRRAQPAGEQRARLFSPVWSIGGEGALRRAVSPALIRAGGMLGGRTLRVDLHPADLQHPRQMLALDQVLERAGRRREAITYDELAALGASSAEPQPIRSASSTMIPSGPRT